MNWCGRPLTSHEVIIGRIGAVRTKTGLTVQAALATDTYPKGIRITDKDLKAFEAKHRQRRQFHGDWNHTITAGPPHSQTRPENANPLIPGP